VSDTKHIEVAVVILNWNGRSLLEKYLPGVVEHSNASAEVILADNASTDDSVEYVRRNFPTVRIIQNEDNGGYSRGYNQALAQVDADFFVLLNSDIQVGAQWIEPVIEHMKRHRQLAACQPKIKDLRHPERFEYAGAAGGFIDKYGYPFCRGRLFTTLEKDTGQYDESCEIFWASGACLFVRSDAFKEVNGLDERLFSHMEEIDMCWRLKNRGYKIGYCADSEVLHLGGGTLEAGHPRKTYYNFRNNLYMVFKNLPREKLIPIIGVRLILDGVAGLKFLFGGQLRHVWPILRAHFSFYRHLGSLSKARRAQQMTSKRMKIYNAYKGSIALSYFLGGKKKFTDLDPEMFNEY
jgi:GT2 family glycosyltransferase